MLGLANFTGCPRKCGRGNVKMRWVLHFCIVIHTYLMIPDYHSHGNGPFVIAVTCVGSIKNLYLYLSCQLLIAFSLSMSLLIWHAVSSSLLIIFKQIWGDRNQFSIILESFFFSPPYSSCTVTGTTEIGYAWLNRAIQSK